MSSGYNVRVIDVMSLLEFSRFEREYFVLKEGTTNVLTLSDWGKSYYNYCESLEIMLNKDGSYTVTATGLSVPGLPVQGLAMSMTIENVGSTQPIAFDAEAVAAVEAFIEDEAVADELFAHMEQALEEDSAVLEGTLFEAGTQTVARSTSLRLSEGEAYMAEQVGNGRPTESGIFRTGNSYRAIARPSGWTGDAAPFPVYVWGNGTPMTLLGAFAQFIRPGLVYPILVQQRHLLPLQPHQPLLLVAGNADVLHHLSMSLPQVAVDGPGLAVPLDGTAPAEREAPDHAPLGPAPDQVGHVVHIVAGVPKHRDLDPPLLQPGNGRSADEVPVLRNLPADALVKHDLAVDHLVQWLAVHPCQQNGRQTVLAKGAGGQIAGIPTGSS